MPRALITGVTGQDGRYLAELLQSKGYELYGLVRTESRAGRASVEALLPQVTLIEGDLRDLPSLVQAVEIADPDEVYNLAAMSSVGSSWRQPELTTDVTAVGALRMLEAIRIHGGNDGGHIRFFQASSSEMFGRTMGLPHDETSAFHPRSPYGAAKAFAHHITVNYRESYGLFAACGILFNHESPRRPPEFVIRKISAGVARIHLGLQNTLALGNLEIERDWGYAGDYVDAMWRILQADEPDDFIVATGVGHSLRDMLTYAFQAAGIDDWTPFVTQDERLMRPADIDSIVGVPAKAGLSLSWSPTVDAESLMRMLVESDLEAESAADR
jgi:GDPmannose 4,6-dehydratase